MACLPALGDTVVETIAMVEDGVDHQAQVAILRTDHLDKGMGDTTDERQTRPTQLLLRASRHHLDLHDSPFSLFWRQILKGFSGDY